MDNRIIEELLSKEIRETRQLTMVVREETKELRLIAEAAQRKADAAWELVMMTRGEMRKPLWKKWFGRQ